MAGMCNCCSHHRIRGAHLGSVSGMRVEQLFPSNGGRWKDMHDILPVSPLPSTQASTTDTTAHNRLLVGSVAMNSHLRTQWMATLSLSLPWYKLLPCTQSTLADIEFRVWSDPVSLEIHIDGSGKYVS